MNQNNQPPMPAVPAVAEAPVKDEQEALEKDPIQILIESLNENTEFDSARVEYPITITDKGIKLNCIIRELSSEQREEYINIQAQKAKYGAQGQVTGIKDVKGLQSKLIHMGLYGPDGNNVPEVTIRSWGSQLTKKLNDIIARLSALDNFSEARAKNS